MKKVIIALYVAFLAMLIIAPGLFIPRFIFGESTGSIALIGGSGESKSVLSMGEPSMWGNMLFPAFILLSVINMAYLASYVINRIKRAR